MTEALRPDIAPRSHPAPRGPRLMARFARGRDGSVAITSAFGIAFALLGAGYAVDLHMAQSEGMRLQDIADAAALAGAATAASGATEASAIEHEAGRVAQAMLATAKGPSPKMTVSMLTNGTPEVTVRLDKDVPLIFGKIIQRRSLSLTRQATAVAGARTPVCMLVLEPDASQAFAMQGNPHLQAPDCALQVNSQASDAVSMGGAAKATTKVAFVHGEGKGKAPGGFTPAPSFGSPVLADPLASEIEWPDPASCDYTNGNVKNQARTLSPGVYCGGIGATTHGELTLQPGVYVIKTGNLKLASQGKIKGGDGVTIILLDPNGVVDIGSQGSLELAAPKSGPWTGIAVAVKPQPTRKESKMQGGGSLKLDGTVYLPSQRLRLTGGGAMQGSLTNRMFVVNSIQMNGNGQIHLKGDPDMMSVGGNVYLKS